MLPGEDASFLAQLIDAIGDPIFVKDRDFRFVLLNRAFVTMVGFEREAMLGKTDYDFFPPAEADFFRAKDEATFTTGATIVIEEEPITDALGRRRVLATTKAPLRDRAGEVTHLIGVIHEITRLKEAEEQLRQINEQLEARVLERTRALEEAQRDLLRKERLAVLGQIAGGIAHQIRNPLAAIKNAAYVLERQLGPGTSPDARGALAIVHDEVQRANRIITDLLDYARMRPPIRRPIELGVIAREALAKCAIPSSVELGVEIPSELKVLADPDQVSDALQNLVANAVEAMPSGGKVLVRAEGAGATVKLAIIDSGTGISEEVSEHLFEPLVTTKPLGLGLGLVTARTLILGQGGSLRCASTSPSGTTFEIELPLAC